MRVVRVIQSMKITSRMVSRVQGMRLGSLLMNMDAAVTRKATWAKGIFMANPQHCLWGFM
jgi:hypothetical protein